jgi:hypothetical protein
MIDWNQLKRNVLAECKDDYVGLWSILWQLRYVLNGGTYPLQEDDRADPADVRSLTLKLVREFLESGLVQAGSPTSDGRGFQPWLLSPSEAIARIDSEWEALGREPNIGDIVWFTTTEKGDQEVEAVAVDKT